MDNIILRACSNPDIHLGKKSLHLLFSYLNGYQDSCSKYGLNFPEDLKELSNVEKIFWRKIECGDYMNEAIRHKHCICLYSYCVFFTNNESDAVDLFFEIYTELSNLNIPKNQNIERISLINKDLQFIFKEIEKRPGLYLGNGWNIYDIQSYLNGWIWAEKDHFSNSKTESFFNNFNAWIESSYPFGREKGWLKIINFLSLESPKTALSIFTDKYCEFTEKQRPESVIPS